MGDMIVDDGAGRQYTVPVNYPGNSFREKTEPEAKKKTEKIISGEVIERKKGFGKRFKESLLGERGIEGAIEVLVVEILVAAFKSMVSDTVHRSTDAIRQGVDKVLWDTGDPRRVNQIGPGRTNYQQISRTRPMFHTISPRGRVSQDFREIIFPLKTDAQKVLGGLQDIIEQYGVATVGDFYELAGIEATWAENKWGWYNLETMHIRPVRGGYILMLPPTQQI